MDLKSFQEVKKYGLLTAGVVINYKDSPGIYNTILLGYWKEFVIFPFYSSYFT